MLPKGDNYALPRRRDSQRTCLWCSRENGRPGFHRYGAPTGKTARSGELVTLPRDEPVQCLIRTNPESATGYEMANNMDQFKVEGSVCLLE